MALLDLRLRLPSSWGVLFTVVVFCLECVSAARFTPASLPTISWRGTRIGTVYHREGNFVYEEGVSDRNEGVAWGSYSGFALASPFEVFRATHGANVVTVKLNNISPHEKDTQLSSCSVTDFAF